MSSSSAQSMEPSRRNPKYPQRPLVGRTLEKAVHLVVEDAVLYVLEDASFATPEGRVKLGEDVQMMAEVLGVELPPDERPRTLMDVCMLAIEVFTGQILKTRYTAASKDCAVVRGPHGPGYCGVDCA